MPHPYDAILLVSFGGPEGPDDVLPFMENVLRGRNVPRQRMLAVCEHYRQFDGVSPINAQNRALIECLQEELDHRGPRLPIYWGNRNWHPLLTDTLRQMAHDGVHRAIAFVTSAFSSYSSCRQYLEDIQSARRAVGDGAPVVDKLRAYYNHPGFIEPMAEKLAAAWNRVPSAQRSGAALLFTAHSIPRAMAQGARYEEQLLESCRLIAERSGIASWTLVYQSRSGAPGQAWLEPDVCDAIRQLHKKSPPTHLVIAPVGFISDHLEVLFDLDTEARAVCDQLGIPMIRAETVGTHPRFVTMIRQLLEERLGDDPERLALGADGPHHDVCPEDCCPLGRPDRRTSVDSATQPGRSG